MSWQYPHVVATYLVTSTVDGTSKLEGNPVVSNTGVNVFADFQPNASPERVFQEWGLELSNPAVMFCPVTSFATVPVNTRVVHEGVTYVVKGVKKWVTGQSNLDYTKAVLTRLNE
jgi:hypothetical protein